LQGKTFSVGTVAKPGIHRSESLADACHGAINDDLKTCFSGIQDILPRIICTNFALNPDFLQRQTGNQTGSHQYYPENVLTLLRQTVIDPHVNDIVGIILAGGLGQRLDPLTRVANKHLLPVYDKPMIFYPLEKMVEARLTEVMIVCSETSRSDFEYLIGDGTEFGLSEVRYSTQIGEDGIAAALSLAENFVNGRRMCVVLGDNLFEDSLIEELGIYREQSEGARVLLKKVPDPERFGVPVIEGDRIARIAEKPEKPGSPFAVTGIYFYDSRAFEIIDKLEPSARGEYEITDVSNDYIERNDLTYGFLSGWWSDCGTFESLYRASGLIREKRKQDMED